MATRTTQSTTNQATKPTNSKKASRGKTAAVARPSGAVEGSATVDQFLATAGTLTLAERKTIVEQATILIEQNYVHLPLKIAMHAVNPVQRLRLLRSRLDRQTAATADPEWRFHAEMSAIFHSVRDLHTNYLLPAPFNGKIAYLPFLVEEYTASGQAHFVVSRLLQGFAAPAGFGQGTEITHWNGTPIAKAVELQAERFAGSNRAARHVRGLDSLTIRSLRIHLPPEEAWIAVTYLKADGSTAELRQEWLVVDNLPPAQADATDLMVASSLAVDVGGDDVGRARRLLYAPRSIDAEAAVIGTVSAHSPSGPTPRAVDADTDVPTTLPGVIRARVVTTPSGMFGHLRIFTFSMQDATPFIDEVTRLLEVLPKDGLILDVRGNGGGLIFASEFLLQLFTPRTIVPEPTQFIVSPLNVRLCQRHATNAAGIDLGPWAASMVQATETGATFSGAFPISPVATANAIGQRYHGPVLLVTDARCYSATDIFAGGFQDHRLGPILGVDDNTGAGGANVWQHNLLKQLFELPAPADGASPFKALPKGADMRVAIRRTLRVGDRSGTPVEDLGILPDHRHPLTQRDLLEGNVDLLAKAGTILATLAVRELRATTSTQGSTLIVELQTRGLDRVDIFLDGRPRASVDIAPAASPAAVTTTVATVAVTGSKLRLDGYAAGALVASRLQST